MVIAALQAVLRLLTNTAIIQAGSMAGKLD